MTGAATATVAVGWAMEWRWTLVIVAILLVDALRDVPPDAMVVRSTFGSPWRPVLDAAAERRVRALSWCPPFTMALVLAEPSARDRGADAGALGIAPTDRRLRSRVRRLRALGALGLVMLVVVVPLALGTFGSLGLLGATASLLVTTALVAVTAYRTLRSFGATSSLAVRTALPLLMPFAAPRAGEVVLQRIVDGRPPLAVLRALGSADDVAVWLRARAFDVRRERAVDEAISRVFTAEELDAMIEAAPPEVARGERYCPRCGTGFVPETRRCSGCEVGLVEKRV